MSSIQVGHDDFRNAVINTIDGIRITRTQHRMAVGMVDEAIEWAFEAPLHSNFYDVICHGSQSADALAANVCNVKHIVTARQLAQLIVAQPDFTGQPVRLLACWVGQHADGFAHQLDNLLGYVGVLACTGELGVGYAEVYPKPGFGWRLFQYGQTTLLGEW